MVALAIKEAIVMTESPKQTVYYYGEAPYGKPGPSGEKVLHLGNFVEYVPLGRGRSNPIVTSFCGVLMISWEEGRYPPDGRSGDFCKNCFRTDAWEFMLSSMRSLAQEQDVSARLAELLTRADSEVWTTDTYRAEIQRLADELQVNPAELFVPKDRAPVRTSRERARSMFKKMED